MTATPQLPQRRSSPTHTLSSNYVLSIVVAVLIVVQVVTIPLSFHSSISSTSSTNQDCTGSNLPPTGISSLSSVERAPPSKNETFTTQSPPSTVKRTKRSDVPDGTFNGYPIFLKSGGSIHSSVQCVGQNYRENAWIHRSCKFRHFCFDTVEKEFVIYQSKQEAELQQAMANQTFMDASNHMKTEVAIGGINTKWTWSEGVPRLKWFPKVIQAELEEDYYELDDDVVWVPYHAFFAQNPGHLVWDDFLPIFTLLRIFNLFADDGYKPLLMRYVLPGKGMWATCDMNEVKRSICAKMYKKFLPLFGLHMDNFTTTQDFKFETKEKKSRLVCAAQGAAGLGMLTDHGFKLHGWAKKDYETMHNFGRGSMLYDFRNFMVKNVGLPVKKLKHGAPYTITFAASTSTSSARNYDFTHQMKALQKAFGNQVIVQKIDFPSKSLKEQVQISSESAIYVSACGGGAVSANFLPHGSSVILYYVEDGGVQSNRPTGLPARLDWDLFNNMAWVRSHWLPGNSMNNATDIDILVKLVRHELDLMEDQQL